MEWTLLQLDQHLHRLRPAPMTELEPYSYLPQPQVSPNKLEHQERRRPQRRQGAIEPISLTMIIVTHQRAVQAIGEGMGSYCATAHAARDHGRNRLNMTLGRDQSRIGADARADRPHNLLPNCLGRCSFCGPRSSSYMLASARRRTTDRRAAHGNGTAFSAVAPSKRPVFAAHRSNIRERYCPQARIARHLTFQPLVQFRPHCGFLSG